MADDDALHNGQGSTWQLLLQFEMDGEAGSEGRAVERVAESLNGLGLDPTQVDRIAKAFRESLQKSTLRQEQEWASALVPVRLWYSGPSQTAPGGTSEAPRVRVQKRPGWGFFLLERQESASHDSQAKSHRVIEVYVYQETAWPK